EPEEVCVLLRLAEERRDRAEVVPLGDQGYLDRIAVLARVVHGREQRLLLVLAVLELEREEDPLRVEDVARRVAVRTGGRSKECGGHGREQECPLHQTTSRRRRMTTIHAPAPAARAAKAASSLILICLEVIRARGRR